MAMTCTICNGPDREAIDKALVAGTPYRHIASQYGTSTGALQRHKKEHLPQALVKAKEVQEISHGDALVAQMADLNKRTLQILENAEKDKDSQTAVRPIREIRGNLELSGKMLGELGKQKTESKHLHLHNIPESVLRKIARGEDDDDPEVTTISSRPQSLRRTKGPFSEELFAG
jgi:hypothetical protein